MASLFSSISSISKEQTSESIGDDNVALSSKDSNPYLSTVALASRNAYDTLHNAMSPLIKGKKSSLKQIDKWLDDWCEQLEKIVEMYKKLLEKIKGMASDFEGTFTLDFAKEAWEIIQDTPILRRYMGEANYWYLYDTLGLIATQPGSLTGDMSAGVRAMIKSAILGLLSMTNGLICLESYLGMIQQYWGALYLKVIPLPLLDSIVPNVTCAYWYKPTHTSALEDGYNIKNDPPGIGFVPIPMPIPSPEMVVRAPSYRDKLNRQNPSTWYYNGSPYYIPRSMELLYKALAYWGSSYTDEWLPLVNGFYPRRTYVRNGIEESHPLITGKTFAQLDTSKNTINGTNLGAVSDEEPSNVESIFGEIFTDEVIEKMNLWQTAYETAHDVLVEYLVNGFATYDENPSTINRFMTLQEMYPDKYISFSKWLDTTRNETFYGALTTMLNAWNEMVNYVSLGKDMSLTESYRYLFDKVMGAFNAVGHNVSGYKGDLEDNQVYMVVPSYAPELTSAISDGWNKDLGMSFVTYKVSLDSGRVYSINSNNDRTTDSDTIVGTYDVDDVGFVMFPSDYVDFDSYVKRTVEFNGIAREVGISIANPPVGKVIGDPIETDGVTTGTVMRYVFPVGAISQEAEVVGELPDALYMHGAGGVVNRRRDLIDGDLVEKDLTISQYANMFLPDGNVPLSVSKSVMPETFVSLYRSYMAEYSDSNEELADVVGYSIARGREIKFPCFDVYGNLLSMQSWHYKEMPFVQFNATYVQIKSGSSLYYKKTDPSKIVFYHSSYMSQSRQMQIAVYHEYLETVTRYKGSSDSYTFYVFPTESISVSEIPTGISLGSFLSVDAIAPNGRQYHYITMRNPIPKCAKYVNPENWSFMDIVHEMYLLATNLADLCGDNGERLARLEEDMEEFHISTPNFIGQLPENNGQYSLFRFGIFKDYADRIEKFVDSIYDLRNQIIVATNTL